MQNMTNLALVYLKEKSLDECIEVCERALKTDALCHKAIFLKGRAFCEKQQYRNANYTFQTLIDTANAQLKKEEEDRMAAQAAAELEKDKQDDDEKVDIEIDTANASEVKTDEETKEEFKKQVIDWE